MKIFKKILCIIIPVIIVFVAVWGVLASGVFNKFTFTVDTSKTGNLLSNPVSNVNIWSIEGNYFDEWVEDRETYGIGDDCFNWSPDDPEIDNPTTLADKEAREIYFNVLYDKYTECSKLVPTEETVTVKDGRITLNTTLDPYAVVFYEIAEA